MVKPEDLAADRTAQGKIQAKELEEIIDQTLRERYDGPGRQVTVSPPATTKQHIIEAVVAKYRAGGWVVESVSDQREGAYLTFTHRVSDPVLD